MSPLHKAARAWAEAGFAIFPVIYNSKEPACKGGHWSATTDLAIIDGWWAENPQYNIGCNPDKSGHCVIDADPPLGVETYASLAGGIETFTIRTPRDGRHYWFLGRCPSTVGKLGPKLDTRGGGSGYVLVPPSIVGGKQYEVIDDSDYEELPEWVNERLTATQETHKAAQVAQDLPGNVERARKLLCAYVAVGDIAREGAGGDERTYRVACEVLNLGLSVERAAGLLEAFWNPYCQPPWSLDELVSKVSNAARYAQNEAGAWAVKPAGETFGAFAAKYVPGDAGGQSLTKFYPRRISEMKDEPPPTWLLNNFLPARGLIVIYGQRKSFKSFLTLDIALGIATGTRTFGLAPTEAQDVVYAVGEGQWNLVHKHVPAWAVGRQEAGLDRFYVVPSVPNFSDATSSEVDALIKGVQDRGLKPALVIIDTMSRAMGGFDENAANEVNIFRQACDRIRDSLGCGVVVVRHSGKDQTRGARGIGVLEDAADTVIEVVRHEKTNLVSVWIKEQRGAPEREDPFYFEGRQVGGSLAFYEVEEKTWIAQKDKDNIISPTNVGMALAKLEAVGDDVLKWVSTAVLASVLARGQQVDPDRLEKLLLKAARSGGRLEVYYHKEEKLWSRP